MDYRYPGVRGLKSTCPDEFHVRKPLVVSFSQKNWHSTISCFIIWHFQTPTWSGLFKYISWMNRPLFLESWSLFSKTVDEDLSNGTNVASKLWKFIFVVTSLIYDYITIILLSSPELSGRLDALEIILDSFPKTEDKNLSTVSGDNIFIEDKKGSRCASALTHGTF